MKEPTKYGVPVGLVVSLVLIGLSASALLLWENPTLRVALLLGVALWGFMRFYYFAFYVIEKYVDDQYKFSGLGSFASYLLQRRKQTRGGAPPRD